MFIASHQRRLGTFIHLLPQRLGIGRLGDLRGHLGMGGALGLARRTGGKTIGKSWETYGKTVEINMGKY